MTDLPTYVLERTFAAPVDLVWKTWTDPVHLERWYGPGAETTTHGFDLRPGGHWLIEMRWGSNTMFQRADYTEVSAPSRLVWLHSSTDADWNVIPSPMMPDWPRVLLTTVTFEAAGAETRLRLTWVPHQATPAEIVAFAGAMAGLGRGWGAGMQLLEALLAELQA